MRANSRAFQARVGKTYRSYSSSIPTISSNHRHHILVTGGGPAGSTTAYFLAKAGFRVTVAERSTRPPYGQGIDITDQAVDVVKHINLFEKIKQNTTGETGFALLDDAGKETGSLLGTNAAEPGANDAYAPASVTNEIEIMRGTLTKIIADAAKGKQVKYRYGCTVTDIKQDDESITAILSDTKQPETFTAIVGADGVASQVRKLTFPQEVQESCYNQTDTYVAYFSMTMDKANQMSYSRFQHGGQGRGIWIRPIDKDGHRASVYFLATSPNNRKLQEASASKATQQQQQDTLEELYSSMDGIRETTVRGMRECKDWHFTRVVQVRLPTWHVGRCALVGDAAYCPSPLTGQGTSMALVGSYILAGELAANPSNPSAAFAEYKAKFEQHVKDEGQIPLGGKAPRFFNPQSQIGVWMLRRLFWLFSRGSAVTFFKFVGSFFASGEGGKFRLPEYPHFK